MGFSQPPVSPRTPAMPFPQDYDPTAQAALETMRRTGQPSVDPRLAAGTVRPDEIGVMPPGWRGGPHAESPLVALSQFARSLPQSAWMAAKGLPQMLNPFEQGKATAEQVRALNAAGHPILGAAAMALGVGAPEVGGETAATRPLLRDLENIATGAHDVKIPQAAIVSAHLGSLSAEQNAARHAAMSDLLKSWGIEHTEVQGKWFNPESKKWEVEKSYLIPGMERPQAVHLGDRFGQQAVITIGGEQPGYHDVAAGTTMPPASSHYIRAAAKRDPHTVLPSGKKITFDFDFGQGTRTGTATPAPRQPGGLPGAGESVIPAGAPEVLGASDPKYAYRTPPVYHGTFEEGFDIPTKSGDLGPHTGTREQAQSLTHQKGALLYGSSPDAPPARLLRL